MKKYLKSLLLAIAAMTIGAYSSQAQTTADPIKREFRGTWFSTVWGIDWPKSTNVTTQKSDLTELFEELAAQNFTTVCFQARCRSDRFYKKGDNLTPWASELTGTRGKDPGYDPLQYAIDEAHRLGLELYVWVNPFRWSTSTDWSTSIDKEWMNKGWILRFTNSSGTVLNYLNPGIPEARQHIIDVIAEIVDNYDIDGIIFDDYFYQNGLPKDIDTTKDYDYEQYIEYRESETQTVGDWRRANINGFVKDVYNKIQSIKPDVRFGIGPPGIAGASSGIYNFPPIPAELKSGDWQYDGQFSDPLAWLRSGTIDFISPQIYWKINSDWPFDVLTDWWSQCAQSANRHHYASHTLSAFASANTEENWAETVAQLEESRKYTLNNAPGFNFFSTRNINGPQASGFGEYLYANATQRKALQPEVTWYADKQYEFTAPINLRKSGTKLTWDAQSATFSSGKSRIVKYSVYAVPNDLGLSVATSSDGDGISSEYLLGVSYTNSYTIPSDKTSGYWYAVCVYDGFSKEWSPSFYGYTPEEPGTPTTLISPSNGATVSGIIPLQWEDVAADEYVIEVSRNSDFSSLYYTENLAGTSVSLQADLLGERTFYWRVTTKKAGVLPAVSDVWSFTVDVTDAPVATLLSPATSSVIDTEKSTKITFTWDSDPVDSYTMEVSETADFKEILHMEQNLTAKTVTCDASVYGIGTFYWRIKTNKKGYNTSISTQVWKFTIESLPAAPQPMLTYPPHMSTISNGGRLAFQWKIDSNQTPDSYTIEVSGTSDWENILVKENVTSPQFITTYEFFGLGTYYWRVTAHKTGYDSTESTWCMFTIDNVSVDESGYTIIDDGALYSSGDPSLEFSSTWIRTVSDGNFSLTAGTGTYNRDFIAHGDFLYLTDRTANGTNGSLSLLKYNRYTGERVGELALNSAGNVNNYPNNDVNKDSKGNVCISNMTWGIKNTPLIIHHVNLETGDLDKVATLYYDGGGRVDHCGIYGDVTTGNFYVFAALSKSKTVLQWQVTNGSASSPSVTTLSSLYPAGATDIGTAPIVIPVSENEFYVDGSGIALTRYTFKAGGDAVMSSSFGMPNCDIKPGATALNGGVVFTFGGRYFIGYVSSGDVNEGKPWQFQLATTNASYNYESMVPYYNFPAGGNFGVIDSNTAQGPMDYLPNANGTGTVYAYVPGSGIAAYTLRKQDWTGVEDGFADDTEVAIIVKGDYITLNAEASCITLCNLAGVTVAEGSGSSLYIDVTPGYYVVRAVVNGVPTTKPVVIR